MKEKRAKGGWQVHNIRDAWREPKETKEHPHPKPIIVDPVITYTLNIGAVRNAGRIWVSTPQNRIYRGNRKCVFIFGIYYKLQAALITAVSNESDYVIDPAANSYSVMEAAHSQNRIFIRCDLED